MPDRYVDSVRAFMAKLYGTGSLPVVPTLPDAGVAFTRARLMTEELAETIIAMNERDREKIADGLADVLYVVFGTAITYGLPIEEIFAEVHRSNMSKCVETTGDMRRKYSVRAAKGPGYSPPDLASILRRACGGKETPTMAKKTHKKTKRTTKKTTTPTPAPASTTTA